MHVIVARRSRSKGNPQTKVAKRAAALMSKKHTQDLEFRKLARETKKTLAGETA